MNNTIDNELTENYRIATAVYNRLRIGSNFYLKDDLIQEAVITIFENRHKHDETRGKFVNWASKVAQNRMYSILKKHKHNMLDIADLEIGNGENKAFDILLLNDYLKKIMPHIYGNRFKQIINLYFKQYKQTEIAQKVGVSKATISNYIKQFRDIANQILIEMNEI